MIEVIRAESTDLTEHDFQDAFKNDRHFKGDGGQ
jgi:hypothetical protein